MIVLLKGLLPSHMCSRASACKHLQCDTCEQWLEWRDLIRERCGFQKNIIDSASLDENVTIKVHVHRLCFSDNPMEQYEQNF